MKRWHILLIVVLVIVGLYAVGYARHYVPQLATFLQQIPILDSNADYKLTELENSVAGLLTGNLSSITTITTIGTAATGVLANFFRKRSNDDKEQWLNEKVQLISEKVEAETGLTAYTKESEQRFADLEAQLTERDTANQQLSAQVNGVTTELNASQRQVIDLQSQVNTLQNTLNATERRLEQLQTPTQG